MVTEFTFYDYIDADGDGSNVISVWMNGDGKRAKQHFNLTISRLEVSPPARTQDSVWCHPFVLDLHDDWKGFKEVRVKRDRLQFRLICLLDDRDVFLVTWGYHKGAWKTDITPAEATDRVTQMEGAPDRYRRKHEQG